jgi:hypothetical protein
VTVKETRALWAGRIDEYNRTAAGETQAKFCARRGYSVKTFYRWKKRLRTNEGKIASGKQAEAARRRFIPLEIVTGEESLLKIRIGKAIIEVRPGVNSELLTQAVRSVSAIC